MHYFMLVPITEFIYLLSHQSSQFLMLSISIHNSHHDAAPRTLVNTSFRSNSHRDIYCISFDVRHGTKRRSANKSQRLTAEIYTAVIMKSRFLIYCWIDPILQFAQTDPYLNCRYQIRCVVQIFITYYGSLREDFRHLKVCQVCDDK